MRRKWKALQGMKYIKVHWQDAQSVDAWTEKDDLKSSCALIETVGIFVGENDEALTIATNYDTTNETYSCTIHIPKGCIVQRRFIKA